MASNSTLLPADEPCQVSDFLYLVRRLAEHEESAVLALAEVGVNPLLYGSHASALIKKLAAGNGVVRRILDELTGSSTLQQRPGYSLPPEQVPGSPAVMTRIYNISLAQGIIPDFMIRRSKS